MLHDTRVLACLTPGCRAAQDPGVVLLKTRVLLCLTPGCRTTYLSIKKRRRL